MTAAGGNFCYKGYRACGGSFAKDVIKRPKWHICTRSSSRAQATIPVVFAFKYKRRREEMLNVTASVFLQVVQNGLDVHVNEKPIFISDITRHVVVATTI